MTTPLPKYIQNKDVWQKLDKPKWVGSFQGGGDVPVRFDLKGGYVFDSTDVDSVNSGILASELPTTLTNKRYVDGQIKTMTPLDKHNALENFTMVKVAALEAKASAVVESDWENLKKKPVWTSEFKGGGVGEDIIALNAINMGDNRIYGLPTPMEGEENRKQAANREYVDDAVYDLEDDMNTSVDNKIKNLEPIFEALKYPEYDNVQNPPGFIEYMGLDTTDANVPKIKFIAPVNANANTITNLPQPTNKDDAATKGFVDESVLTCVPVYRYDLDMALRPTTKEMEDHVVDYTTNVTMPNVQKAIDAKAVATTWAEVEKTGPGWLKTMQHVGRSPTSLPGDMITKIQGGLDMGGSIIQNVGEPLLPNDAVPLHYFEKGVKANDNPKFKYDVTNSELDATANLDMNSNVIKGLRIVDAIDPSKVYVPKADEAVSKKYLDDMVADINANVAPVVLPDWMNGVTHTGTPGTKSLFIRRPLGTTNFKIEGLDDPVDLSDAATKKYIDSMITYVSRQRSAQQAADRIASFKWSLTRVDSTSDFTLVIDVTAKSTLSYLSLDFISYQLIVDEIVVANGSRTGDLIRLLKMDEMPGADIKSGSYKFSHIINLGNTTPPISSGTAPLLITIMPVLYCKIGNDDTALYPSHIQVGRGAGINNTVLVSS